MAHAAGYDHDIFISYAHDDNHAPGDAPGWVDQFKAWLESLLIKRRGKRSLSIWRDTGRMRGNTLFDDAIREALEGSALFFALVSRNYLNSSYCREELTFFHHYNSATPGGLRVGNQSRLFTLLLNNIPYGHCQQWSPALEGTAGFAFHDAADETEVGDFTAINDLRFQKQMRPLVDAVELILETMEAKTPAAVATGGSGAPPANTFYMAAVAEPLQDFRERLIDEIQARQGTVLSEIPPPWEFDGHGERVRRLLQTARFSIHLFDQWQGGTIIDRPAAHYPQEQFTLARESPALPLVWVPPALELETIENPVQRQFLLDCANGEREAGQFEFVRAPRSAFIDLVLEKLAQPLPAPVSGQAGQTYLVDTHQNDNEYAFDLARYLAKLGVDVDFNQESRDPLVSLERFERAIRQVKHLIILFGRVAPGWLQARIKLALKAICDQFQGDQECCLEKIWVYKVPASRGEIALPRLPPIIKIQVLDNSHADAIDPAVADQLLKVPGGPGVGQ